jgi:RNA polymerase sigma-70 factor (ECF subfamily)
MSAQGEGQSRFSTTRWSLVQAAAGDAASTSHRVALSALLNRYLPALRAHLRYRSHAPPDRVDDLLQSFVANRVLEKRLLSQADRARGKFRTFLLTSLNHFVSNELRHDRALRRGGRQHLVALDDPDRAPGVPAEEHSVADEFDHEWARTVVSEALARMRTACERDGRSDLWEVFSARVVEPANGGSEALPYDQLVRRFRIGSPAKASNLLMTAKRSFSRALREVVAEYAGDDPASIDEELRELRSILTNGRAGSSARPVMD